MPLACLLGVMALPVDYQTCRVTGRWVNNDAPDYTPAVGHIRFLPHATRIVSAGTETVVLPGEIVAFLDDSGEIDIEIPATNDPDITPLGFTYRVIEVVNRGTTYDIEAPWDQDIDLSTVVGVEADDGATIIIGPTGPPLLVKGTVANYAALPGTPTVGDVYLTDDDGHAYQWTGTTWLDIGAFNFVADPAANVAGARTLGTGAQQAAPGNVVAPGLKGGVDAKPALSDWFAKLRAATAAAPVDVVWITDSIGALGTNAEPAHPWIVTADLNKLVGAPAPPNAVFAQAHGGHVVPTATSSNGTAAEIGLGGHSSSLSNGQIVTHTATCKAFRVTYVDTGTGTLTFRDGPGGTVLGTVTLTNTGKLTVWQSSTLTDAAHTLHITSTGNTNVGQIIPLRDTKVIGHMATHAGYGSINYTSAPSKALDLIELLATSGNLGLVVLATGANDNPYSTEMPALRAAIEAAAPGVDIVLWVPYPSNAVLPVEYAAMHPVALASGLPLIDSGTYYAGFAASWSLDGTHPGYPGMQILAAQDMAVLSGDPIGQLARQVALSLKLGTTAATAAPGDILTGPNDLLRIDDDFVIGDPTLSGSIGERRWTRTGGTSLQTVTGMAGHLGAVRIVPATGANDSALSLPFSGSFSFPQPPTQANYDVTFWFKTSGNTSTHAHQIGMGAFQLGMYFEHPAGTSLWDCVVNFGGTDIRRTTTAVPVDGTWVKARIVSYSQAAIMLLNDVLVDTMPLPFPGLPFFRAAQTSGSGSYLDIDRVSFATWGYTRPTIPA